MMEDPLASVALAISSYRSDEAVAQLLERLFVQGRSPFGAVIVVDSLGSGAIASAIAARAWPVRYINADRNLGSAGNLALRLATAAQTGMRWCYAINHDGVVDPEQVRQLVAHGEAGDRIGAVYPSLSYQARGSIVEQPRRTLSPRGSFGAGESEDLLCHQVSWSSSNCALYRLDAIRQGVETWPELWMGWEDLAIGWSLRRNGWTQIQCRDVTVVDTYEYRRVGFLGWKFYITEKPSWYAYYQLRNLLLIRGRSGGEAAGLPDIFKRLAIEIGVTLLYRSEKMKRLGLIRKGISAGMSGITGKGPVP